MLYELDHTVCHLLGWVSFLIEHYSLEIHQVVCIASSFLFVAE
jgi:hypothetical protein